MNQIFTKRNASLFLLLLAGQIGFAQISGNVTIGSTGAYPSLTGTNGLFEAINTNGLNGNVTAIILENLTETGSTSLNQWTEIPTSSNFSLTIVPGDATEKIISGNVSGNLITLAGADRVTFDGRFGGSGRYLRFRNTSTTAASTTFSLLNDASNNVITYCNIEGAGGTTGGDILIGATNASSGNDNNFVTNNIIGDPTSTLLPYYLIRVASSGTTLSNDNGIISNNEFLNWQGSSSAAGYAIFLTGTGNSTNNWTVQNNSIYQTDSRISALIGIYSNTGSNQTISGNKIGGSNNVMGGNALSTSKANTTASAVFTGISVSSANSNTPGIGGPSTISDNQITNIKATGTASANLLVYGISVSGANNILNNSIGSTDSANSIISNGASAIGIFATAATGSILKNTIKGNSIRNFTTTFTSNKAVTGIFVGTAYGTGPTASIGGIFQIDSNYIDGLYGSNSAGSFAENSVVGIIISSMSNSTVGGQSSISRNDIKNIVNTNAGNFQHGGITTHSMVKAPINIFGNKISNLYSTGATGGNKIIGIGVNGGTNAIDSICNNVVAIGAGNPINNSIYGIYDINSVTLTLASAKNLFNNTVVLTGNQDLSVATANSYAFYRAAGDIANIRNNVFLNKRVGINSGTGAIYAMHNNATNGTVAWNSEYNMLYSSMPAKLVYWNSTATAYDFEGYQSASLRDSNSVTENVTFANESANDFHIATTSSDAWNVFGRGIALAALGSDLEGNIRSTTVGIPTTLGAYEIAMPTIAPADMVMTGAITPSGNTIFTSGGRKIAEITWGNNVPTSITAAKFYPGVPAPNQTMTGPNLNSYFELNVTPDVSTYDYTIKTYYTQSEANGIANSSMTGIKKHATNAYVATDVGNTSSNDINGLFLTSNILTDFSIFSMTGNTTPLSIDLKNIGAINVANKNKIEWSTAAENKADYFELEKSTDARHFTMLAKINAKGEASDYTYWDEHAALGVTYYRLRMAHDNGSFSYSKTVSADVKSLTPFAIKLYPNPVQDKVSLKIDGLIQGHATIQITDIAGKLMQSLTVDIAETEINMSHLNTGIYFIKYSDEHQSQTFKINKL